MKETWTINTYTHKNNEETKKGSWFAYKSLQLPYPMRTKKNNKTMKCQNNELIKQ